MTKLEQWLDRLLPDVRVSAGFYFLFGGLLLVGWGFFAAIGLASGDKLGEVFLVWACGLVLFSLLIRFSER